MPRYDVFLEGRTENSTCYFGVAVMADDQKEAEYLGHEAGRKKHRECDEIEVVSVRLRQAGKRRLGIYKVVCENSVDEGEQRHYRVIEALYLRDRPLSPTAVAEREKIDKRTVYKDVDAACATLSALIFGIDGIKKA